jgi:pheromone shutdown protein TraB
MEPMALTTNLVVLTTTPVPESDLKSTKESAGLTYLIKNPDVMVHAQKVVRASGVAPGRDFQRAMEQVAIDHYNSFGRIEGRQLDGETSTRSLLAQPKFDEPLIKVSDSGTLTYLVNNPDVMVHAQKVVRASGVSPGRDFQRAMEQVAIEHYIHFGRKEGRASPGR